MNPLLEKLLKEEDIFKPYTEEELIKLRLKDCTKNPDGTYSCDGDVDLSEMSLTKLPVRFKEVGGSFNCFNNNLTTLEGAPEKVGGYFDCSHNKDILIVAIINSPLLKEHLKKLAEIFIVLVINLKP